MVIPSFDSFLYFVLASINLIFLTIYWKVYCQQDWNKNFKFLRYFVLACMNSLHQYFIQRCYTLYSFEILKWLFPNLGIWNKFLIHAKIEIGSTDSFWLDEITNWYILLVFLVVCRFQTKKRVCAIYENLRNQVNSFIYQLYYDHSQNILGIFDVLQVFLSPNLKQSVIISNKYGTYELPHELPNDLRS